MAMRNMNRGIPRLWKDGYKSFTGLEEAILKNCEAATSLANIVRTSFGPNGLSKIIINRIEKVYVTTDAATIISELEVQHPAAKVLCLAAQMQQAEVGDGANFVVVFAGELLKHSLGLLRLGLHPSDLVRGYKLAGQKVLEYIPELTVFEVEAQDLTEKDKLVVGIKSAISSKQYGLEDILSDVVARACQNSMPANPRNFIVDNVRAIKILGGSIHDCDIIRGMVLDINPLSMCKSCEDTKVAIFTCSVDWTQTETKGTVLIHTADELINYNKSEEEHIHGIIKGLKDQGVSVIMSGEKLGEMALHFIDKYRMVGVRITSKWTLRRLCRTIRARPIVRLTDARPEDFGHCASLRTQEIGARTVTIISQTDLHESQVSTIVLRGSTANVLADLERAVDDGVNIVRAMTRNGKFVPGAGALEIELARRLKRFAQTQPGLEQYAINKYAEALEVVPRTLSENTGLNETEIISQLYRAHESEEKEAFRVGINIEDGSIQDMTTEGVIDLAATREMGLTLATQAAITILRVDHIIMKKPAGGPRRPTNRGHWDDNDDSW